jgi:hypothetical protein
MQGALAERPGVAVPLTEEDRRSLRVVDRPRRGSRRRPLLKRPAVLLVLFAVSLALLGVGRVTLTFAVVQESLDTAKLVEQQRTVRQANAELSQKLAKATAATRVHNLAVGRLRLVAPSSVVYLPKGDTAAMGGASAATASSADSQAASPSVDVAAGTTGTQASRQTQSATTAGSP